MQQRIEHVRLDVLKGSTRHADGWAESHYGARARTVDLMQPTGTIDPSVALLARVGDHALERAAERVAPTFASLKQYTVYFQWIVTIRATAEPAFLMAALDAAAKDKSLRYQTLGALGEVPGIVRALDADPELVDKLDLHDVRDLIGQDCDPADRATIAALIDEHPKLNGVLKVFDQCLAQQKMMEPLLRRWLTKQ